MDLFERLGVAGYINAHDTYTVYGGSRMSRATIQAMAEASRYFVDISELQRKLGEKIAEMTRNEGAFITNGAAGGLMLASAVCMAKDNTQSYSQLPKTEGLADEIIVLSSQRNPYDAAIRASGAKIVEPEGKGDEKSALKRAIGQRTAAVFYFAASFLSRDSMPLTDVIRVAHAKGIPVVVDAAAQLPPIDNFWRFTEQGADLVLFSGGKTLCGPQDSGLILGRKELIEACYRFGAPVHGVCRSCKTSKEAMAGLFAALEEYFALDHQKNTERMLSINERLADIMRKGGLRTEIVHCGPAGQEYPRVFGYCETIGQAVTINKGMRLRHIYIGLDEDASAIYISPLNLKDDEVETVGAALRECLSDARVEPRE